MNQRKTLLTKDTYSIHAFNSHRNRFDAYLTELRVQAKKCAYGQLQDELIRDRLVVGIRDDKVRSPPSSRARFNSSKMHRYRTRR